MITHHISDYNHFPIFIKQNLRLLKQDFKCNVYSMKQKSLSNFKGAV